MDKEALNLRRPPCILQGPSGNSKKRTSDCDAKPRRKLLNVPYRIVDSAAITPGRGPHPAASPFDKLISQPLGVTAFEVYQVELPPDGETVRHHHVDDQVEDVYAFLRGGGWVIVDDQEVPVTPGEFIAVAIESRRMVRAGDEGLDFIALCGSPS